MARRQKRGGMQWSVQTSDSLAALQMLALNDGWDAYWQPVLPINPALVRAYALKCITASRSTAEIPFSRPSAVSNRVRVLPSIALEE